jgi:hypothetical protein
VITILAPDQKEFFVRTKSYNGIELRVATGSASRFHDGHEERVLDHQRRIQAELAKGKILCKSNGTYNPFPRKRKQGAA